MALRGGRVGGGGGRGEVEEMGLSWASFSFFSPSSSSSFWKSTAGFGATVPKARRRRQGTRGGGCSFEARRGGEGQWGFYFYLNGERFEEFPLHFIVWGF